MKTPIQSFTVFCQEAGGSGTIHIASVEATDLASAIQAGREQCLADWNGTSNESNASCTLEDIHCLGVAEGYVTILHWEDQVD